MRIILMALLSAVVIGCATGLGIYDSRSPYRERLSACLKKARYKSLYAELSCRESSWLECRANGFELDCGEKRQ